MDRKILNTVSRSRLPSVCHSIFTITSESFILTIPCLAPQVAQGRDHPPELHYTILSLNHEQGAENFAKLLKQHTLMHYDCSQISMLGWITCQIYNKIKYFREKLKKCLCNLKKCLCQMLINVCKSIIQK